MRRRAGRDRCRLIALMALAALGGCGPATRGGPVMLTPTTPLGTVVLRVGPPASPATAGAAPEIAVTLEAERARPRSEIDAARAALGALVGEARLPQALAERMVRVARERTSERLVPGTDARGPVSGDTVLEIAIAAVELVRRPRPGEPAAPPGDPALTLVLTGSLRLWRSADAVTLLARPIRHEAETKAFTLWTRDDFRELRAALGPAVEALAVALVDEVF